MVKSPIHVGTQMRPNCQCHVSDSIQLATSRSLLSLTADRNFDSICEQQPIGRALFKNFCVTNEDYHRAINFLDAVVSIILLLRSFQGNAMVTRVMLPTSALNVWS